MQPTPLSYTTGDFLLPKIRDMAANTIIYESPLDQLKQRAELNYQNYQEEKQNTAEKYGFVTLSDKSYKAIQQGEQNIQATQGLVESLLADNDALANLGLDDSSLSQLTDVIQQASDPEAMRNDLLTAVAFSQHLNIPVSDAMQNLDSLLEAQFYTPVKRGKTAAKAIKDSIKIGDLTTDRGMLGTQLKNAEVGSEEYNNILAKLQSIDAEMESLQDWMPRPWYVSLAKLGAQSAAYSLQSAAAGGVGAAIGTGLSIGLGLAFPGLKVSTAMVTGAVSAGFRGVYGYAVESGNLYYDLVSQGIDADVAKGFSSIYGVTAAAIEQGLGGVVSSVLGGFGVPVNSVASSLVSKLMANGTLANTAAVFGTRLAANIVSEGIEEALQSLSENGATALAYAFNNKLTTTQKKSLPKDFAEVLKEAWQEGLAGAGGALFLGAAGAGLETRLTVKQGAGIAEAAKTIHSQQAYEKKAEQFKPEDISDSDWENLLSNAWEQNAEARDLSWSLSSYREAAGATIADGAVYDSSTGRAFEANTKGLEKGDLFFQESTKQTSSGTVHTVKFGNTSQVGKGAVEYDYEQRQAIGEEISEDDAALANAEKGKKYISKIGEVTYRTTDSGKMEILSSSMEKGYEGYEKQALQQVISMYPEYDVQWNNPADKQAIYDEIVSENPQGIEKGLNYGKAYDSEDTQAVKRWLGTNFSSDDAENSVMAILLQSAAKRMGLTGKQFIDKYSTDIREIDAATEAEIRKMGKNPDFVKGFTKPIQDGTRAVIYAGKNADVTTFQHELNHVLMAIGENKADFEKAFHDAIGSKGGLKRFSKFVEQNIDVITIAAKNGKYDPDFLSTLYNRAENDGRDWTRIEEEFEDQLFEAYQRKGETLNPELKGVLRRIAESFRRVYRALRNSLGVSLNEEIRDYYDRLYGFDRTGADSGRDFSSWRYSANTSLAQDEYDSIKDKSYAEQFEYIRDKYVGTDEYMRAPNGKASNLTEEQWIMVRTPNFKEWFGDWENDPENASKVLDENGEPKEVYHGTGRSDRVGDVFDPKRATSGPMAFFTDNKEIADSYARNKPDTSLEYDAAFKFENRFRVKRKGWPETRLDRVWDGLTTTNKRIIAERAKHITLDDEAYEIIYDEDVKDGIGNINDRTFREYKGNALRALWESWVASGTLFGEEEGRFLEVLKLTGLTDMIDGQVWWNNPWARYEKTYEVFMRVANPFDTATVNKKFFSDLKKWYKTNDGANYLRSSESADNWDKNDRTLQNIVESLEEDIENSTSYTWTTIPDFLTAYLKSEGYDGIKDIGGKQGGDIHTVWVPFESTQIKDSKNNSGAFSSENNSILFQDSEDDSNRIDNTLLPVEDAIKKLRKELKSFEINPADWQGKHIAEFYNAYPEALIKAIKEYPKVLYDNVLMFAGLNEKMMPYKKEVIEAKIIQELVGKNCIVLPLNVKPINNLFRIDLNISFPDAYMVSFADNGFIELKHTETAIENRIFNSKNKKQLGFPFVFSDVFDSNFLDIWYSGKEFNKIKNHDFAAVDIANRKIYLQIKKGTPWEFLLQSFRVDSHLDRPRAENKAVTAGTEMTTMPQRFVVEIETTPTLESYINEHENVNKKEHLSHEEYLKAPRSARLFQEESPQDVWLEDIAFIANGCADYEQFRIAVEAFAMGEPTEDAEADMERIFNARNISPASSMPYDADESIDFFGDDEEDIRPDEYEYYLDSNGEEMDLYGERDYEMYDEETEEFIVTSWAMARDTDNETAEEAKATLENPPRMMNDRASAFVDILSDDQQLKDYLSALRSANYIVQYGSERDLDFDPRENPERYTMLYEASNEIKSTVAPFIRNIVFVKKGDTGEIKSISERGMQIIRGIIRKNADEYMNLYYLATGNDTWKKGYDADLEIQKEADRIAAEKGLSISEKRSLVQDLRDKALEDKILKTGEVTNEDVRGLLSRNKQRAELAKQEADLAKKMFDERLAFKKGELIQLTLKAQQAEESYYKASAELSELNDKLERIASRIAKRAKGMGIDTKLVQEQGKLASKKAYLERLVAQRANILKNLFNEGKYYGEAGTKKIAEIDAQMGNVLKEIVELEERDVITTDEAINKIIGLTAEIRDEKARQRLYDKVTLERWKGAKKLREAQEKADIKLRDTIYVERLKASKAKAKAEAKHDAEITWERWKGAKKLNEAQKRAESNIQAQRIHDAIYYGRMINRRDQTIENLKIAKDQERAALRLKKEMTRLATGIMRAPSSAIHLDEAEQILKIQATIDPAFRKTMRVDGMTMDINDLKDMLRNDPSNPLLTMLSEDQLRRLLKKSLDQMNLAELEAVAATVKNLRDKGRAKRMEYLINQRIETANIQAMLIAQVMKSGKYKEPEIHGSFEERERGKSEKWKSIYYSTYNMARLSQMLDDDKKGNFYTLLVRRKRELQDVEARAILSRRKPVEDVLEQNGISYEDFYRESIETAIDGKKATFSLSQLAYVYLSKNNEKNRAAVAYGNLISQAEKANAKNGVNARIIGQGKDFDQARNEAIDEEIRIMGDRRYAELYEYAREAIEARPEIKAAIEAIEASLNSDRFADVVELMRREFNEEVTREAYYLPLNRVGFVGESPAERLKADILNQVPGMRASVDKGMTKERITISPRHQTEVDLDLAKVWDNSIYDQEHLLAFLEYTRQLDHVFKAAQGGRTRELREAIENSYGDSMLKRIDSYINEVANPSSAAIAKEMSAASKIVKAGRTGIYAATFGLRVSSVLNQLITSPAAFLGKASPLDMARSSLLMMAHPLQTWKEITELSSFMLNRDADVVMRMIQEYNSQQGLSEAKRMHGKALEISMLGMKWADRFAVSIGWHAIYSKELNSALESGMTEAEAKRKAVKIADEYVQETQPQGDVTEQSELVKSDAFSIIAPFQTALNTVWQNVTYDIPAAFKEGRYAEALGTAMGYVIAGVLLALVKGELAPQEDDENEGLMLARRILSASTSQFTETAPLVGDTLSWIVNLAITGEKDYIYNSSTMPLLESLRTFASRVNDREWLKALESVLYGTGQYFGAPISEIKDIRRAFEEEDWRAIIGWRN